ncbi:MAG: hypothetical protein ACU85U_16855 [Gammaproteobacteria bacterium]
MIDSISDQACIVGIGHTEYSKDSGRSELKLACEAIGAAIEDAGLTPADIDSIAKYTMDNNDPIDSTRNLGIPHLRYFGEVAYGGGGPVGTIMLAAMAVATGQAKAVVAFRAMSERSGRGTPRVGICTCTAPSRATSPKSHSPAGTMRITIRTR